MSIWTSSISAVGFGDAISNHLMSSSDALSYPVITTFTLGILAGYTIYKYFLENNELFFSNKEVSSSSTTAPKQPEESKIGQQKGASDALTEASTNPQNPEPKHIEYSYRVPCEEQSKTSETLFLNGKFRIVKEMRPADFELSWNLLLANEINKYVREHIWQSGTYPARDTLCDFSTNLSSVNQQHWDAYQKTMNRCIESMREEIKAQGLCTDEEFYQQTAEKAKAEKIGNCGEMAILGGYFPDRGDTPISLCFLVPGDHVFLRIGKESRVFCDPWGGGIFPEDRSMHLRDYIAEGNVEGFPKVCDASGKMVMEAFDFPPSTAN